MSAYKERNKVINTQAVLMLICFVATCAIWVLRLFPVRALANDDITFLNEYMVHSAAELAEYIKMRWETWSSRVLIECVLLFFLSKNTLVWVFITALTMAFVPVFFWLCGKKDIRCYVAACVVTLLFPVRLFESAGYITTSVIYIVPIFFGMIILVPFAMTQAPKKRWLPLFVISAIMAANHEQIAALLIGIICYCIIVRLIKHETVGISHILIPGIILCEFIICMTAPGNALRTELEITRWLPEYAEWSLMTKMLHGVAHTLDDVLILNNIKYIFVLSAVAILVYAAVKRKLFLLILSIAEIVLLAGLNIVNLGFGEKYKLHLGFAGQHLFLSGRDTLYLLAELLILALLIVMLVMIDVSEKEFFKNSVIMLGGFASAFIIGFSPTVYASLDRIYICLVFVMFYEITSLMMYCINNKKVLDPDVT